MERHRLRSRWTLAIVSAASAAWAISFGLSVPLASLWLQDAGFNHKLLGLSTSTYYFGVVLAAPIVPVLMRLGARRCMVAGMIVDGATVALLPWTASPVGWFLLRFAGGVATALCLIPMETLVGHNAPPDRRASDFGIYAFCVALGVGLGPLIGLPLYPVAPHFAFLIGGGIALAGAAILQWGLAKVDAVEEQAGDGQIPPIRGAALSFGTAWLQGFLEGGMLTFLSVYLLGLGFGEVGASGLIGVLFLGVVLFQLPLSWLADHWGTRRLLLACHACVLLGLGAIPSCRSTWGLGTWLFVVGACSAALYPLGLALLGARVPTAGLARANAWYLACNCAGSLSGPPLMGAAFDACGGIGLFVAGGIALVIAASIGLLLDRRDPWTSSAVAGRRAA